MYNIVLKEIKENLDFKELFLYNSFSIFETDNIKTAAANCKKGKIIYFKSYEPSMEIIQKAKEKKTIFLINLSDIIYSKNKSAVINRLSLFLKLCIKYKIEFIFSFLASDEMEMRTFKEGIALGVLLGLKPIQAKNAFNKIKEICDENEY